MYANYVCLNVDDNAKSFNILAFSSV